MSVGIRFIKDGPLLAAKDQRIAELERRIEERNEMLEAAVTKNALLADRIKELEAEVEKLEEYLSRVPAGMYL